MHKARITTCLLLFLLCVALLAVTGTAAKKRGNRCRSEGKNISNCKVMKRRNQLPSSRRPRCKRALRKACAKIEGKCNAMATHILSKRSLPDPDVESEPPKKRSRETRAARRRRRKSLRQSQKKRKPQKCKICSRRCWSGS